MGCDRQAHRSVPRRLRFNSRTRMGCDLFECFHVFSIVVSIHAPAWGATVMPGDSFKVKTVSIHAPAWGATVRGGVTSFHNWFQFTHPHGVRQEPHCPRAWLPRFNSRTRMGCDQTRRLSKITLRVSIHAPAWGATAIIVTI